MCSWLTDIYIATLYYHLGKIFNESQSCNVRLLLQRKPNFLHSFPSQYEPTMVGTVFWVQKTLKLCTFSTAIIIFDFAVVIEHT